MTRTQRKKWKARLVGGLIALTGLGGVGCKHQLFTEPADADVLRRPNIPAALETRPHDAIMPATATVGVDPATVLDLKRQLRPIALKEAIAIALEQGNTGGGNERVNDALPQFSGGVGPNGASGSVSGTDSNRAYVLDPALWNAALERSLSKFDARWITSMSWNKQDQATLTLQQSFSNGDQAQFSSTLAKPLPTGGVAGITTSINYLNLSNPPPANSGFVTLSTSYTPRVQFIFEQPLLQGFGVEANQLLPNHPGSLLVQGFRSTGQGSDGILITRVRTEQARAQFDVAENSKLLNVEVAYWNLYAEYYNLHAQQEGLVQAFDALKFIRQRVLGGLETEPQLLPQLETQYHQFYLRVVDARGRVLEADRQLRGLLGMRSDDGTIFTPTDEPVRTPMKVDYRAAYEEGLQTRPEILLCRLELKARQLDLQVQKIGRMPDLRLFSSYDVNGLGGRFFGPDSNAFASLASNQFNSWQFGLRLDMPLGFRDANAQVRIAQLNLWRAYYQLGDAERKLFENLVVARRQLDQSYATMVINRRTKESTQRQVELIAQRVQVGQFAGSNAYLTLTTAQQNLATAAASEYRALADYNAALARIEFAKGTIQRYNNVTVAEGPLPGFVNKKAADHFRERAVALKLRDRAGDQPVDNLSRFELLPLDQMPHPTDVGTIGGTMPPPLAPPLVAPPAAAPAKEGNGQEPPMSKPAATTIKAWDKWESQPSGSGVSVPGTLPAVPAAKITPPADQPAGTFVPNGTLTLPKRLTSGGPTTAPGTPINTQTK
jgi:outer membrane protein TolC